MFREQIVGELHELGINGPLPQAIDQGLHLVSQRGRGILIQLGDLLGQFSHQGIGPGSPFVSR